MAPMHIPDGYLSPSTCAAFYAASAPFWAVALRRVRRLLLTRFVPLVSLVAAFSFVVMMFNLPLPGGTTGHAVGIGIAAIVLGPWGAMLAVSVALLIQALFFGDGGVTTLGANVFNMAIVGSLTASACYRLIAARTPLTSPRRVAAAGIAGYLAINASALCAALQLGIQPLVFTDRTGAPLYAPYPPHIAIPAVMIGHLTLAGLAELVLSAGVVAYLQKSDLELLRGAVPADAIAPSLRPLWIGLAMLLILTPLGLLAAGTAWGEWSPAAFSDPASRAQIAETSGGAAPPAHVPAGLDRLASVWAAPLRGYTAPFVRNPALGYSVSALLGAGFALLAVRLLRGAGVRPRAGAAD
jgi:cobalt/nickel transport system permease protein